MVAAQAQIDELRINLLSDFLLFTRFFFHEQTNREFIISKPQGNESHFVTIARELTKVFMGETTRLWINCPPGWSKSTLVKSFVAWATAHYPDANHMYISYSHELASAHTHSIRQLMQLPLYKSLFGVEIMRDSSAKDFFKTIGGGAIAAFGSAGAITGRDAGLPGLDRYSGAVIIDDIHKPDEIHSDVTRDKIARNFYETIVPRCRGINVPIIMIGQRLHEDDMFARLETNEGAHWNKLILTAIDAAGNVRYPEVKTKEQLLDMKLKQPYVYSSQYDQCPIPSGGALYKKEYFPLHDEEPALLASFVTCDTSESEKEWNDKTVFSFWGLYKPQIKGVEIPDLYCLHWLDCVQLQLEPKDLEPEFINFWADCMRHSTKPQMAFIEKKSTGVTLVSVLKNVQGIKVVPIERTVASGSKSQRFIDMQAYIAAKQISLPTRGKHTQMVLDHMERITANDTHRWDDIADTCYDAVRAALIDKTIVYKVDNVDYDRIAQSMNKANQNFDQLRRKAYSSHTTFGR